MGCQNSYPVIQADVCFPSMVRLMNEGSRNRCQAVLNRLKRYGYLGEDFESSVELCGRADEGLFRAVVTNYPLHVMRQPLPPERDIPYHLRPRAHNMQIPAINNYLKINFIYRMLYANIYHPSS